MTTQGLLSIQDVCKSFGPLAVLKDIHLEVTEGESMAIVGPSGCGKSTLLHLMGALDVPDSGQVSLRGQALETLDDNQRAEIRNREIGFIFQAHQLLPQCNVVGNALLPVLAARTATAEDEARAIDLLCKVGLGERLTHRPAELSGGECQRVACVRALMNSPSLLLADEPTGSLDSASASDLVDLLLKLNDQQNVALVVVTHNPAVAERMSRTVHLEDLQRAHTSP